MLIKSKSISFLKLLAVLWSINCANAQSVDSLRLNDIRILASHNSYKRKPDSSVLVFITKHKEKFGTENDPIQIDYGHEPLTIQLDSFNVRGFELDVYADPKGGRYKKRGVNGFVKGLKRKSKIPELNEPGFKLIHISDVDYNTNNFTLKSALVELNDWSKKHPNHIPLFVNVEAKGSGLGDESGILNFLGFKKAIKFDSLMYESLNDELVKNIDSERIFTPKELKGSYSSIKNRLDDIGWPPLIDCLGKIIFILEGDKHEEYQERLVQGADYPMFVYGGPNEEMTAFIERNDPIGSEPEIKALTEKYIVRTRADAGTLEARAQDYSRFESAKESCAQIISTDYYKADQNINDFRIALDALFLVK